MDLEQLLAACRDALDDNNSPPLWPDEELTRYLNNAVLEAALRTRCLQDDSGTATRLTLVADQARYALLPEVLVVRAVHVTGRSYPLERTTAARLDKVKPGWSHEVQQAGIPQYALFDVQQKTLTLYPPPASVGTAYLRIWRLPTADEAMSTIGDEPVITLPNPEQIKHWALHEAYLKKDAETFDPQKAAEHEAEFERVFGPRPSVHDLMLWSTQPIVGARRMPSDF